MPKQALASNCTDNCNKTWQTIGRPALYTDFQIFWLGWYVISIAFLQIHYILTPYTCTLKQTQENTACDFVSNWYTANLLLTSLINCLTGAALMHSSVPNVFVLRSKGWHNLMQLHYVPAHVKGVTQEADRSVEGEQLAVLSPTHMVVALGQ